MPGHDSLAGCYQAEQIQIMGGEAGPPCGITIGIDCFLLVEIFDGVVQFLEIPALSDLRADKKNLRAGIPSLKIPMKHPTPGCDA